MLLFKITGFILITTSSSLIGLYFSLKLKKRCVIISEFIKGMSILNDRIRMNYGEINTLIRKSFNNDILIYNNFCYTVTCDYLKNEDEKIINDFFNGIGMSDTISECKRTELFSSLLSKQLVSAEKKYNELSKTYRSIGILIGIFISIFLS